MRFSHPLLILTAIFNVAVADPITIGGVAGTAVVEVSLALISGGFALAGSNPESKGTCGWFSRAPFCYGTCPADYFFVRQSTDLHITDELGNEYDDPTFGRDCWFGWGHKYFCCRGDSMECLWKGNYADSLNRRWSCAYYMEGRTLQEIQRAYYGGVLQRECGELHCTMLGTHLHNPTRVIQLKGPKCREFEMDGLYGRAYCGVFNFYKDENSTAVVYNWFKTGVAN